MSWDLWLQKQTKDWITCQVTTTRATVLFSQNVVMSLTNAERQIKSFWQVSAWVCDSQTSKTKCGTLVKNVTFHFNKRRGFKDEDYLVYGEHRRASPGKKKQCSNSHISTVWFTSVLLIEIQQLAAKNHFTQIHNFCRHSNNTTTNTGAHAWTEKWWYIHMRNEADTQSFDAFPSLHITLINIHFRVRERRRQTACTAPYRPSAIDRAISWRTGENNTAMLRRLDERMRDGMPQ